MKHYRPISRMPAAATTALGAKYEFKTGFVLITADASNYLTHNIGLISQALFQGSLALGDYIEIVFDDFLNRGGDA